MTVKQMVLYGVAMSNDLYNSIYGSSNVGSNSGSSSNANSNSGSLASTGDKIGAYTILSLIVISSSITLLGITKKFSHIDQK